MKHMLLLLIYLTLVYSYRLPVTRRAPTRKPIFPDELRARGQKIRPDLRIPNPKFCAEMQLLPESQYLVLPWWYNYCGKLVEKQERKYQNSEYFLPLYRNVLNALDRFKKMRARENYLRQ